MDRIVGCIREGGVVKNVTVKDSSFTGSYVGAIAGCDEWNGKDNKALPSSEMKTEAFAAQLNASCGSNTDWLEWEIRPEESDYPMHVQKVLYGDVNGDDSVTGADALEILKYAAHLIGNFKAETKA